MICSTNMALTVENKSNTSRLWVQGRISTFAFMPWWNISDIKICGVFGARIHFTLCTYITLLCQRLVLKYQGLICSKEWEKVVTKVDNHGHYSYLWLILRFRAKSKSRVVLLSPGGRCWAYVTDPTLSTVYIHDRSEAALLQSHTQPQH